MKIKVNGEIKQLNTKTQNISLSETMLSLGYESNNVVVELNNLIINSEAWELKNVFEGDKLEIVSIVGGG